MPAPVAASCGGRRTPGGQGAPGRPRAVAGRCGRRGRHAGALGLHEGEDVLAGDPATATGPDDLRGLQAVLAQEAADRGRHPGVGVVDGGRCGGRLRRTRPELRGGSRRRGSGERRRRIGARR